MQNVVAEYSSRLGCHMVVIFSMKLKEQNKNEQTFCLGSVLLQAVATLGNTTVI
jgi:hypothetical protein